MKLFVAAAALAAFAGSSAYAQNAQLVRVADKVVVHDAATGETYVLKGKRYPRWKETWVAPPGYAYHAYVVGETVPEMYWAPAYAIDWSTHNLPKPDTDAKWVRVGNDAVLIRIGSGNVIDRIPDFYY
jgi:Ni/Co efflux regulator RcnB